MTFSLSSRTTKSIMQKQSSRRRGRDLFLNECFIHELFIKMCKIHSNIFDLLTVAKNIKIYLTNA